MPDIVIKCPVFGQTVPTGLKTEAVIFESLPPDLPLEARCRACRKLHKWQPRDAWIDGGTTEGSRKP